MKHKYKDYIEDKLTKAYKSMEYNVYNDPIPNDKNKGIVLVNSRKAYITLLRSVQSKYIALTEEEVDYIINHETEHVIAGKRRFGKYGNRVRYQYGLRFSSTDNSNKKVITPFNRISGNFPATIHDWMYITKAPSKLSKGDLERLKESRQILKLL